MKPRFLVFALLLGASAIVIAAPLAPAIFFSDLDSGPNNGGQDDKGVFVTVWGQRFGAERGDGHVTIGGGHAAKYVMWSDNKIVFQLGEAAVSGPIVVTTLAGERSNGIHFNVRPGRIFFVDGKGKPRGSGTFETPWSSPASFYERMKPGDTVYFRAGVYGGNYGGNWGERNFALGARKGGSPNNPVAFVGYPGEAAVFKAPDGHHGNFTLTDTTRSVASYVTIANLTLQGTSECISGGGFWENDESGGTNVRVIGNRLSARYTGNTMTGLLSVNGDTWRILGNEFVDTGTRPPINNNHAVYVQTGADDVDVGWNRFHRLRMGHVIQVHTDVPFKYEDIRIHDNVISAESVQDARGINVGRALPGSYGSIYNNVLYNIGQDFSAIALYYGDWKVYNNTLFNVHAGKGMLWVSGQYGGQPTAEVVNNIFYSDGASPYVSAIHGARSNQLLLDANLYFGYKGVSSSDGDKHAVSGDPLFKNSAGGDFRLGSGSPAIDKGSKDTAAVVKTDHLGVTRPQGKTFDIGALEAPAR